MCLQFLGEASGLIYEQTYNKNENVFVTNPFTFADDDETVSRLLRYRIKLILASQSLEKNNNKSIFFIFLMYAHTITLSPHPFPLFL